MIRKYGRDWNDDTTAVQMELTAYRHDFKVNEGGLGKIQHFKNAYSLLFPDMASIYFSWTEQMIEAFVEQSKVGGGYLSILGGSGCSKSYTMGYLIVTDWLADPNNTICLAASTTIRDLNDRVWKTVRKSFTELPFEVGKHNRSKPESIISPNKEGGIYAVALQDDPDGERLKGFHPKRLRIVVDEATAFSPAVLASKENWTSANKEFILVTMSNFKGFDNLCATVTEPVAGWNSIDYFRETGWKTKIGGQAILFDMCRSPVYTRPELGKKLFFLKTKALIDKSIYGEGDVPGLGEDHPRVMQYIRSIPVFDDSAKTILNHKIIERSGCRLPANWIGWGQEKLAALDPAFVVGGDACVLQLGTLGYESDGAQVLQFDETIMVPIEANSKTPSEYQILDFVTKECKNRGILPANFIMDSCGTGRGLGSIFQHEWSDEIMLFDPRQSASDSIVDWDFMKTGKEIYDRMVTELWWEFRRYCETEQLRGLKGTSIDQFCTRLYDDTRVKTRLETKEMYKRRIYGDDSAGGSPDEADACTYLLYLAKQFGFAATRRDPRYRDMLVGRDENKTAVQDEVERWWNGRLDDWEAGFETDEGGSRIVEDDYSTDPFD